MKPMNEQALLSRLNDPARDRRRPCGAETVGALYRKRTRSSA